MPPKRSTSIKKIATAPSARCVNAVATLIRNSRLNAKKSYAELALYIGADDRLIIEYESGEREIPLHHVYAFSNFLSILPSALMAAISQDE